MTTNEHPYGTKSLNKKFNLRSDPIYFYSTGH